MRCPSDDPDRRLDKGAATCDNVVQFDGGGLPFSAGGGSTIHTTAITRALTLVVCRLRLL